MAVLLDTSVLGRLANVADAQHATAAAGSRPVLVFTSPRWGEVAAERRVRGATDAGGRQG